MRSNAGQSRAALPDAAIDDEFAWPLGDVGIEIVHEHPEWRFGEPALGAELGSAGAADDAHIVDAGWHGHGLSLSLVIPDDRASGRSGIQQLRGAECASLDSRSDLRSAGNDSKLRNKTAIAFMSACAQASPPERHARSHASVSRAVHRSAEASSRAMGARAPACRRGRRARAARPRRLRSDAHRRA